MVGSEDGSGMIGFLALAAAPAVVGVAAGHLGGGRLTALAGRVHAIWLLWIAVVLQAVHTYLHPAGWLLAVVFGVVLSWFVANLVLWPTTLRWPGGVILTGGLLNGVALAANGRMPYTRWAADVAGVAPGAATAKNGPATGTPRLPWLVDTVPVPWLGKIVSLGDLLIGVGVAVLIAAAMRLHDVKAARR
jgi:hypothetical protein